MMGTLGDKMTPEEAEGEVGWHVFAVVLSAVGKNARCVRRFYRGFIPTPPGAFVHKSLLE